MRAKERMMTKDEFEELMQQIQDAVIQTTTNWANSHDWTQRVVVQPIVSALLVCAHNLIIDKCTELPGCRDVAEDIMSACKKLAGIFEAQSEIQH